MKLDYRRVTEILLFSGLNPNAGLKTVRRVGVWKQPKQALGTVAARRLLVELHDAAIRDQLLSKTVTIFRNKGSVNT